jgi:predicted MFS family arabinose efflux permease
MAAKGVLKLLRENSRLRWFSAGLLVSRVGDTFNGVALAWLGLSLGGPRALGLILLCFGLPRVPASPLAGYLLDRLGARTLLITDNVGRGCVVATVPVLGWLHLISVWALCLIAATAGVLSTLTDVGEYLVTPALVAEQDLVQANAIMSLTYEAAVLIGPAAAGLLVDTAGYEAAFGCDALSFAVMACAASLLPRHSNTSAPAKEGRGVSLLTRGFRGMIRLRVVLVMTVAAVVFLLLSGMMEVIWPAYSRYTLHTDAGGFGLLMTSAGLGATLGVLGLARRLTKFRSGTALGLVLCGHGLLFLPFVFINAFAAAIGLAFCVYFVGMSFYTLERTIVQNAVPPEIRGEVIGARRAITSAGYPLGAAIAGPLVSFFGPAHLFGAVGVIMCLLAAGVWLAPPLRNLDGGKQSAAPRTASAGGLSTSSD